MDKYGPDGWTWVMVDKSYLAITIYILTSKRSFGAPCTWRFCITKDFVVFQFLDTFRIQQPPYRIQGCLVPPCTWRFRITKDFVVFLFLDTFCLQWTPTVFKVVPCSPVRVRVGFASLRIFTVSRHFWYVSRNRRNNQIPWKVIISRDFVVLLFLDTFNTESVKKQEKLPNFNKKSV